MSVLDIKSNSDIPKYKQIVQSIERAVVEDRVMDGDRLPSINSIRSRYALSRDTVLFAYQQLKEIGLVKSVAGKGYFVTLEQTVIKKTVFLLFDEFNAFKKDLFDAIVNTFPNNVRIDVFFHHFNKSLFNSLLKEHRNNYDYFVIMPSNIFNAERDISLIDKEKVYLLDQVSPKLRAYPAIFQNFEKDIFSALMQLNNRLKKYKKLTLIFDESIQPNGMLKGFEQFCQLHKFNYTIIHAFKNQLVERDNVYIIPDDRNLIRVLKQARSQNFSLGKETGVISYNDSMLHEMVEDGITTISTDFVEMGKTLVQMIQLKQHLHIENKSVVIQRNSL